MSNFYWLYRQKDLKMSTYCFIVNDDRIDVQISDKMAVVVKLVLSNKDLKIKFRGINYMISIPLFNLKENVLNIEFPLCFIPQVRCSYGKEWVKEHVSWDDFYGDTDYQVWATQYFHISVDDHFNPELQDGEDQYFISSDMREIMSIREQRKKENECPYCEEEDTCENQIEKWLAEGVLVDPIAKCKELGLIDDNSDSESENENESTSLQKTLNCLEKIIHMNDPPKSESVKSDSDLDLKNNIN